MRIVGAKHPIVFNCKALSMHGCFAPTPFSAYEIEGGAR